MASATAWLAPPPAGTSASGGGDRGAQHVGRCVASINVCLAEDALVLQPTEEGKSLVIGRGPSVEFTEPDEAPRSVLLSPKVYGGVLGVLDIGTGPHLILLEDAQSLGHLEGHELYAVTGVEFLRLGAPNDRPRTKHEAYYENDMLAMARQILTCGHVFFSFTMDLTRPIQHQMDLGLAPDGGDCLADDADPQFFWNRALQQPLLDAELSHWALPVIFGHVSVQTVPAGATASTDEARTVALITRLGRWTPPPAAPGTAADAPVPRLAPILETELVVKWGEYLFSHVQRRGELPLDWLAPAEPPPATNGTKRSSSVSSAPPASPPPPPSRQLAAAAAYYGAVVAKFEAVTLVDVRPGDAVPLRVPAALSGFRRPASSTLQLDAEAAKEQLRLPVYRFGYFGYDDEEEITTIQRGLLCTVSADAADLGVTVQATIAAMAAYSHLVSLGYFADDAAAAASPLAGVLAEAWAASVRSGVLHRAWLALSKPLPSDAVVGADRQTVPDPVMLAILSGSGPSVGDLARQLARLERPSKTPERDVATTVRACAAELLAADEQLLGGWFVTSINKRDEEQARYLILSSAAFYRVKVHPKSGKIQRHVRTSLSDLELVQKGVFKRSSSSAGAYGTRFFTELFRGQTSVPTLSDSQLNERRAEEQQRTYVLNLDHGSEMDRRVATCELVLAFTMACANHDGGRKLKVVEETIARRQTMWSVSNRLRRGSRVDSAAGRNGQKRRFRLNSVRKRNGSTSAS